MVSRRSNQRGKFARYINNDRISKLPDPILHRILSFLPSARDIVKTSILSKRWENVWASLPCLSFNDEEFDDGEKFKCFVDGLLLLREASVDVHTFNLLCQRHNGSGRNLYIRKWLRYAIKSNVKVIHLVVTGEVDLPRAIFACQSLEELSLELDIEVQKFHLWDPLLISLRQLKKLHLVNFAFEYDLKMLFIFPLLEDLCLEFCDFQKAMISCPSLTKLKIESCTGSRLQVCCPELISLHLGGPYDCFSEFVLENLSSLITASVYGSQFKGASYAGLSSATSLVFNTLLEDISMSDFSQFCKFSNLKDLTFHDLCLDELTLQKLFQFLTFTPNLERLTLEDLDGSYSNYETNWESMNLSLNCPHLKIIKVSYCEAASTHMHQLMKVFLANTNSIEKLTFSKSRIFMEGFQLLKRNQ